MAFSTLADETLWLGRVNVDLKTLPQTVDLSGSRLAATVMLVFAGGWTIFALSIFASFMKAPAYMGVFAAIFPIIGLALLANSIRMLLRRRIVKFEPAGVTVHERKLLSETEWYARYSEFEGVLLREHTRRNKNSSTTYQIIELKHPDPSKTLPLHVSTGTRPPRSAWESYGQKLALPALRQTADGIMGRDVSDFDQTLKMLGDAGKIDAGYDPSESIPDGLSVETTDAPHGEELKVTILANRFPLWLRALFFGFPAIFVAVGVLQPEVWPMSLFGGIFICAAYLVFRQTGKSPRTIRLTRDALTVSDSSFLLQEHETTFKLDEIEDLSVQASRSGMGLELRISSDRREGAAGHGLDRDALDWLRRYITAAIVNA